MVRSPPRYVCTLLVIALSDAVLRFPDAGYDMRWPVQLQHCDDAYPVEADSKTPSGKYVTCLQQLREHVRDDLECSAITPDNAAYVSEDELKFILTACDHFRLAFECIYDQGLHPTASMDDYDARFRTDWGDFVRLQHGLLQDEPAGLGERFIFANSTGAIVKHHTELIVLHVASIYFAPHWRSILIVALLIAARLQFLIENLSMSLLVNHLLGNLEHNSILDGTDYVKEMYGDVRGRYIFHDDLGPKRWNVLCHLIERLAGATPDSASAGEGRPVSAPLRMIEVGVDTANVSLRLLEHYPATMLALHVGVDPYRNKPGSTAGDRAYEWTRGQLAAYGERSLLLRTTSVEAAAALAAEDAFDLIYLDARHDHDSVKEDIISWAPLVRRPGGILAGHDFQWQYLGLPMAVTSALQWLAPEGVLNLASDGMWWYDL